MKLALIGASKIAQRLADAAKAHKDIEIKTVFSRNPDKAEAFKEKNQMENATTDINTILEDPEIDAVYVAVPHKFHKDIAIEAMKHKKAVLCEKPAVVTPEEMDEIIEVSNENNVLFMEAMKTRFIPAYKAIKEKVESGEIGEVKHVSVSLCSDFTALPKTHYVYDPVQGGPLLDGGCYEMNWILEYLGDGFDITNMESNTEDGIERYVKAELKNGPKTATFESAMDRKKAKTVKIEGTEGIIEAEDLHRPTAYTIQKDGNTETVSCPYDVDDMYSELDAFYKTWKEKKLDNETMPRKESRKQAIALSKIKEAALKKG